MPSERAARADRSDRSGGRVEVAGLTWRPFGRREPVLRDLDLTVPAGERVLLIGPSGAGKSTLLRGLAGLLQTAEAGELTGTVTVDGSPPGERAGAVGLVLQEPGAGVVAATVGRDVAFGLENTGMPRVAMPPVVADALDAVRLDLPPTTPTHALSGGQTQRLALAGALALEPSLLLLDEPTAMLDAENAASVRASVDAVVRSRGLTLVVVEHVLGPWVDLVDRLVVLAADGSIVADGPVRQTLADHHDALLAMGVWVPGEPPPSPVTVPPGLLPPGPDPDAAAPALRATPLAVTRRTRTVDGLVTERVAARTEVPITADAGSLTVLVGPSGSGKSTVLHALAGFLEPTTGEVRTASGVVPEGLAATDLARLLAWVPQWASSTIVASTVLGEALATSAALGDDSPETEARARALLDLLGLGGLLAADPRQLSGGELRRLAVASALVHGPRVVLADEPTVGLDRHTWAAVVGVLAAHRAAGGAIVAASHDSSVIARAERLLDLTATPRPTPPDRRRPWLARCGPLSLFAGSALAVPTGVISPGWRVSLVVLAVMVGLGGLGMLRVGAGAHPWGTLRGFALRLIPGALAAVSVGWSTWLLGGRSLDLAATGVTRVLIIVLPSAVLLPFVDTDRLGDHLAQRLHLPDRPVVALSAALYRMQSFGEIWTEIGRARRVRGLGVSWRHPGSIVRHVVALSVGLFVRSLRAASELAVAMDARGFATAYRRTWWAAAPWRGADTLCVVAATLPLVVAVLGALVE